SQRGYLLTGDPRYLDPYKAVVAEVGQELDKLRGPAFVRADDAVALAELTKNIHKKLAEMDITVRMRLQGNEAVMRFVMMTDAGKEHMDAIREQARQLIDRASRRVETSQQQVRRSLLFSRIGIATITTLGLLAFYLYLRQTTALKLAGDRQQVVL